MKITSLHAAAYSQCLQLRYERWAKARATSVVTVLVCGMLAAGPVLAAPKEEAASANVVSLSASGFLETSQDWLVLQMSVTKEGQDASSVQSQLRVALDAAMSTARAAVKADQQLQARSGSFGVYPRRDKNGKISSWQGTAELIMEGRDFTRIARTAANIDGLTISSLNFSLSQEAQRKLESEVQALAIERFKTRAVDISKGFGFNSFGLREISVSSAEDGGSQMVRHSAMAVKSLSSDSDVKGMTMEPGVSKVSVTVSGTVVLR